MFVLLFLVAVTCFAWLLICWFGLVLFYMVLHFALCLVRVCGCALDCLLINSVDVRCCIAVVCGWVSVYLLWVYRLVLALLLGVSVFLCLLSVAVRVFVCCLLLG